MAAALLAAVLLAGSAAGADGAPPPRDRSQRSALCLPNYVDKTPVAQDVRLVIKENGWSSGSLSSHILQILLTETLGFDVEAGAPRHSLQTNTRPKP